MGSEKSKIIQQYENVYCKSPLYYTNEHKYEMRMWKHDKNSNEVQMVLCKANHEGYESIDSPLLAYKKDKFLNTLIFHFVRIINSSQYQFVNVEFIQDYSGYQKKLSNLQKLQFQKMVDEQQTHLFELMKINLLPMFKNETITI